MMEAEPEPVILSGNRRFQRSVPPRKTYSNDSLRYAIHVDGYKPDNNVGNIIAIVGNGVRPHMDLPLVTKLAIADDMACGVTHQGGGWHDTCVAGIIAANNSSGSGIIGLGVVSELLSFDVSSNGFGGLSQKKIAAAIEHALVHAAKKNSAPIVINLSIATDPDQPLDKSLEAALNMAGHYDNAMIVMAAGNNGVDLAEHPVWPAAIQRDGDRRNMIVVETRKYDGRTTDGGTNFSRRVVDLAAPAPQYDPIVSTSCGPSTRGCISTEYETFSATSAATAVVSGAVSLVWSDPRFSKYSAPELKQLLLRHARSPADLGCPSNTALDGVPMLNLAFLYDDADASSGSD